MGKQTHHIEDRLFSLPILSQATHSTHLLSITSAWAVHQRPSDINR